MKTGLVIKELRLKKGLTQEELANQTELSTRTIQRIENGDVDPRAYTLQMIAKALEVDFSIFVEEKSPTENNNKNDIALAFLHLSGIIPIIFPTLLLWKSKKDVENINKHFKDVMSFQLTAWIAFILGFLHYYIAGMPYTFYAATLFTIFFPVMNAINVFNGKSPGYLTFFNLNKQSKPTKEKN